eukprot:TRINITY_DN11537_c0_g1_i1.p1 TRINITY_DN11537_c0_g1~~TRINITY_DN11537_c0_g1_i1.p1  ORF type:complete len:446 (-),score=89.64 TRINITY_DN11537_c0_g1_i1:361-1665(-)
MKKRTEASDSEDEGLGSGSREEEASYDSDERSLEDISDGGEDDKSGQSKKKGEANDTGKSGTERDNKSKNKPKKNRSKDRESSPAKRGRGASRKRGSKTRQWKPVGDRKNDYDRSTPKSGNKSNYQGKKKFGGGNKESRRRGDRKKKKWQQKTQSDAQSGPVVDDPHKRSFFGTDEDSTFSNNANRGWRGNNRGDTRGKRTKRYSAQRSGNYGKRGRSSRRRGGDQGYGGRGNNRNDQPNRAFWNNSGDNRQNNKKRGWNNSPSDQQDNNNQAPEFNGANGKDLWDEDIKFSSGTSSLQWNADGADYDSTNGTYPQERDTVAISPGTYFHKDDAPRDGEIPYGYEYMPNVGPGPAAYAYDPAYYYMPAQAVAYGDAAAMPGFWGNPNPPVSSGKIAYTTKEFKPAAVRDENLQVISTSVVDYESNGSGDSDVRD